MEKRKDFGWWCIFFHFGATKLNNNNNNVNFTILLIIIMLVKV